MKSIKLTSIKFGIVAVVVVLTVWQVKVTSQAGVEPDANKDASKIESAWDTQVSSKSAHDQRYSDWSAPINLGSTVNSTFNDVAPTISKDGLSLYFTSNREPGGFSGDDIYVSHRNSTDDPWGPPVNLGATINTSFTEREPALSRDGHLMFFVTDRQPGGFGDLDIWVSRREHTHDDFAWQPAENLGAGVNSAGREVGPSYFENDEVGVPQLYFTSSRFAGRGILNICVSEQAADGSFGPAFLIPELGSGGLLNSSIRHDGLEIFIHSNRPGSIGNTSDLWVATRETVFDAWSEPINLGPTVNSTFVENLPDISSDGETLFFTSNRLGSLGLAPDLWMSTRTKLSEK